MIVALHSITFAEGIATRLWRKECMQTSSHDMHLMLQFTICRDFCCLIDKQDGSIADGLLFARHLNTGNEVH